MSARHYCGLTSTAPLEDALRMRIDQLIGWAKSGQSDEHYLMDIENVATLRDDLIRVIKEEVSVHPLPLSWDSEATP